MRPILYLSGPYSPGNGRTVADNIAIAVITLFPVKRAIDALKRIDGFDG